MPKALFLSTQSEFGGAQRYVYEASKALSEKNSVLVAAGQGDGELFSRISELKSENPQLNLETRKIESLRRVPNPFLALKAVWEIKKLLKKEKPQTLFLCSTTAGLLGSMAGFLYRKNSPEKMKIVYRIGGWAFRDPRSGWKNRLIFWAEKFTAPFKDLIIVNSESDWRIAVKNGIAPPERIIKIYNGIDVDSLEFLPREQAREKLSENLKPEYKVVGTVANFYRTKGLNRLIEAFKMLDDPDSKLVIVGEGRQRKELEDLIFKNGLQDRVFLTGRIPEARLYLKAFDVFALASLKEGFPWIVLEAMAAELPMVCTKTGALPEIIEDKKNGLLAEPGDSKDLAEKIQWLLNNSQEAKAMGIRGKAEAVEKFSLRKMIEETEKAVI